MNTSTEPIIEFDDLRRSFVVREKAGRLPAAKRMVHAVDGITAAHRRRGRPCGYIGANGAGKSTTIKMLTGHPGADLAARVRTCGLEPVPQRRRLAREIGVVFGQRSQLWWDLPLRESFRILGAIHRLPAAAGPATDRQLVDGLGLRGCSTPRSASCRWASGCAVRWRRRWSTGRGCWCWTSRRSGWT